MCGHSSSSGSLLQPAMAVRHQAAEQILPEVQQDPAQSSSTTMYVDESKAGTSQSWGKVPSHLSLRANKCGFGRRSKRPDPQHVKLKPEADPRRWGLEGSFPGVKKSYSNPEMHRLRPMRHRVGLWAKGLHALNADLKEEAAAAQQFIDPAHPGEPSLLGSLSQVLRTPRPAPPAAGFPRGTAACPNAFRPDLTTESTFLFSAHQWRKGDPDAERPGYTVGGAGLFFRPRPEPFRLPRPPPPTDLEKATASFHRAAQDRCPVKAEVMRCLSATLPNLETKPSVTFARTDPTAAARKAADNPRPADVMHSSAPVAGPGHVTLSSTSTAAPIISIEVDRPALQPSRPPEAQQEPREEMKLPPAGAAARRSAQLPKEETKGSAHQNVTRGQQPLPSDKHLGLHMLQKTWAEYKKQEEKRKRREKRRRRQRRMGMSAGLAMVQEEDGLEMKLNSMGTPGLVRDVLLD